MNEGILTATAFLLVTFLFPLSAEAQDDDATVKAVRQRAERFLQAVRDEKWGQVHGYLVIVTHKGQEKSVAKISDSAEDAERRSVAVKYLKGLYEHLKPGEVRSVRLDGGDNTKALIGYMHEDLDGFDMISVDGEWYYTIEVWN